MRSLFGLEGKRILVLGGGQGMGEATVRLLASLGASVGVGDVDPVRAGRVVDAVTAAGGAALPFAFDVLDDEALVAGIAEVERELGPLDGLATIVGMASFAPIVEMDMAMWDKDHNRNLRYFFLAAREVAKGLLARGAGGAIACVSSVDGVRSAPFHAAYGAAKAGLFNLARSMADEWSPHGIRVNAVASGSVVTPRIPLHPPEIETKQGERIPMRRRGTVDEIAKALVFLLSDMASYVTGQTLAVDGGYTAATLFDLSAARVPRGTIGIDPA